MFTVPYKDPSPPQLFGLLVKSFDATGNGYFSDFFLESSRKVTNFSMLILYSATLLKIFIRSRSIFFSWWSHGVFSI